MTKNKYSPLLFSLLIAGPMVSGCDQFRHTFGLDHAQGDAFNIPTNPPLSMPPQYDLRPPVPGAQNPGEINHQDKAQEKMLGQKVALKSTANDAEKSIVQKAAKTTAADPKIRATVEKDVAEEQTFLGKLKNIGSNAKTNLAKGSAAEDYRKEEAAPKKYEDEQKSQSTPPTS